MDNWLPAKQGWIPNLLDALCTTLRGSTENKAEQAEDEADKDLILTVHPCLRLHDSIGTLVLECCIKHVRCSEYMQSLPEGDNRSGCNSLRKLFHCFTPVGKHFDD